VNTDEPEQLTLDHVVQVVLLTDEAADPSDAGHVETEAEAEAAAAAAAALIPPAIAGAIISLPDARSHHAAAELYLANLAESSRRTMRVSLDLIASVLSGGVIVDYALIPWGQLRYVHTQALRAAFLHSGAAPATINRHLSALRSVLHRAWRLGLLSVEDYQAAVDLEPAKGETVPSGRSISSGELRALFDACAADASPVRGLRDAALLALLYQAQLRRSEAIGVDVADFNPADGSIFVSKAKGKKQRTNHLSGGGLLAVEAWIRVRGSELGPLFFPILKSGRIVPRRLTDKAARYIVGKRAAQACVLDISPHDFRRSSISDLLDQGVDLSTVQKIAGHSDPKTTARYDRRPERTRREAASRLHVPFSDARR